MKNIEKVLYNEFIIYNINSWSQRYWREESRIKRIKQKTITQFAEPTTLEKSRKAQIDNSLLKAFICCGYG